MGGITDSLFGGSKSKTKSRSDPKDLTPQEFVGLRQPVASSLTGEIQQGGGSVASGPFAAPVSGNEQQLLNQIQQFATQPSATQQTSNQFLQALISGQGGMDPGLQGMSFDPLQLSQGGTPMGQVNPFLQAQIEAAQRPLIQAFNEETLPGLRSQFARAGQQIQGRFGSSPFQMAQARASGGLADALGDIGTELAMQDFAQRQALASQEFQQLRGLEAGGQMQGRELDLASQGMQSQAFQQDRQQKLQGVSAATGVDSARLENMLSSLEAQALPRLVEQFGIDRGLEEFRRREDRLLQLLATAGALGSPTVGNVSTSTGRSNQNPDLSQAVGAGIGAFAAFSSRDYKENITEVDERELSDAVKDVELASFTYRPEMHIHGGFIGPIAEDVPDVFRGADGKTVNLYNMVSGLVAASHQKDVEIEMLKQRLEALEDVNHG